MKANFIYCCLRVWKLKNKRAIPREKPPQKRNYFSTCNFLMLSFFAFIVIFDLVSKYLVNVYMAEGEQVKFIPGFINFFNVHNSGAAWGFFSGYGIALIIITLIFLFVYVWYFVTKHTESAVFGIASGLVLGGTIGNLFDRVIHIGKGCYVRDFLNFQFIDFPVFNIADAALTIGIVLLAIYFLFIFPRECKKSIADMIKNNSSIGQHGEMYLEDLDNIEKDRSFSVKKAIKAEKIVIKKKKQKRAEDNGENK